MKEEEKKSRSDNQLTKPKGPTGDIQRKMEELKLQRDIVGVVIQKFAWDETTLPKEVKISEDNRSLYLQEDDYLFRTVYADIELKEGIHYWEIIADARSEHELKIGVSGQKLMNQKAAFSDYEYGWAFFGVG